MLLIGSDWQQGCCYSSEKKLEKINLGKTRKYGGMMCLTRHVYNNSKAVNKAACLAVNCNSYKHPSNALKAGHVIKEIAERKKAKL